eukprot:TRINITY_DN3874_c0_g1_i1.p1 TRINITY_DN3874_c0_g1~~TRINITY_DN3874_c0_g1_i1.p1  ORF type:complete len:1373 (+),score=419.87 TRINITY_DN3874_c0_g1_i1:107-4225(+)
MNSDKMRKRALVTGIVTALLQAETADGVRSAGSAHAALATQPWEDDLLGGGLNDGEKRAEINARGEEALSLLNMLGGFDLDEGEEDEIVPISIAEGKPEKPKPAKVNWEKDPIDLNIGSLEDLAKATEGWGIEKSTLEYIVKGRNQPECPVVPDAEKATDAQVQRCTGHRWKNRAEMERTYKSAQALREFKNTWDDVFAYLNTHHGLCVGTECRDDEKDVNTASAMEMDKVEGVTIDLAMDIVSARTNKYKSLEDMIKRIKLAMRADGSSWDGLSTDIEIIKELMNKTPFPHLELSPPIQDSLAGVAETIAKEDIRNSPDKDPNAPIAPGNEEFEQAIGKKTDGKVLETDDDEPLLVVDDVTSIIQRNNQDNRDEDVVIEDTVAHGHKESMCKHMCHVEDGGCVAVETERVHDYMDVGKFCVKECEAKLGECKPKEKQSAADAKARLEALQKEKEKRNQGDAGDLDAEVETQKAVAKKEEAREELDEAVDDLVEDEAQQNTQKKKDDAKKVEAAANKLSAAEKWKKKIEAQEQVKLNAAEQRKKKERDQIIGKNFDEIVALREEAAKETHCGCYTHNEDTQHIEPAVTEYWLGFLAPEHCAQKVVRGSDGHKKFQVNMKALRLDVTVDGQPTDDQSQWTCVLECGEEGKIAEAPIKAQLINQWEANKGKLAALKAEKRADDRVEDDSIERFEEQERRKAQALEDKQNQAQGKPVVTHLDTPDKELAKMKEKERLEKQALAEAKKKEAAAAKLVATLEQQKQAGQKISDVEPVAIQKLDDATATAEKLEEALEKDQGKIQHLLQESTTAGGKTLRACPDPAKEFTHQMTLDGKCCPNAQIQWKIDHPRSLTQALAHHAMPGWVSRPVYGAGLLNAPVQAVLCCDVELPNGVTTCLEAQERERHTAEAVAKKNAEARLAEKTEDARVKVDTGCATGSQKVADGACCPDKKIQFQLVEGDMMKAQVCCDYELEAGEKTCEEAQQRIIEATNGGAMKGGGEGQAAKGGCTADVPTWFSSNAFYSRTIWEFRPTQAGVDLVCLVKSMREQCLGTTSELEEGTLGNKLQKFPYTTIQNEYVESIPLKCDEVTKQWKEPTIPQLQQCVYPILPKVLFQSPQEMGNEILARMVITGQAAGLARNGTQEAVTYETYRTSPMDLKQHFYFDKDGNFKWAHNPDYCLHAWATNGKHDSTGWLSIGDQESPLVLKVCATASREHATDKWQLLATQYIPGADKHVTKIGSQEISCKAGFNWAAKIRGGQMVFPQLEYHKPNWGTFTYWVNDKHELCRALWGTGKFGGYNTRCFGRLMEGHSPRIEAVRKGSYAYLDGYTLFHVQPPKGEQVKLLKSIKRTEQDEELSFVTFWLPADRGVHNRISL